MWSGLWNTGSGLAQAGIFAMSLAALLPLASCNKIENTRVEEKKAAPQKTFSSPEEAGKALFEAAKDSDQSELAAIFGPEGKQALFTGDAAKDKANLQDFVAAYNQMHRWAKIKAGGEVLYVGADNYGFPIPLGQNPSGQWYFDTAAGKDEIQARSVGAGERIAIAACQTLANAEHKYFAEAHDKVKQYAGRFVSDPGKQNGLYWPIGKGQPLSPLGHFGDFAKALDDGDGTQQFKGYNYRILTKQGDKAKGGAGEYTVDGKLTRGFAILAYPAEYRESGIMSFLVGADGVVYERDLGENTAEVGAEMTEYNPGDGWVPAAPPEDGRLRS